MKYQIGEIKLETNVDKNQFGDVEMDALLMDVKAADSPVLFEITEGGSVFSRPVIHDRIFYCGCCDYNFYALDTRTGRKLWRFATKGVIALDAVLEGDTIYFGSFDNSLYALGLDGKLAWKFQTNGELGTPAIHDGVVYAGSEDGNLYAIDTRTGQELWRFRTGGAVPNQPTIHKGIIYFGSWDHHLYALSLDGKRVLWKFRCGNIAGGATVYRDRLYFGSFDHHIYSTTLDGKLLWKYQLPVKMYSVSKPIISDGTIFVGLMDDYMYALTTKGKLIWKFRTGHMIATDPAVHKGVVYFGSCDGNFYALDARKGRELWRFTTSLPVVAPPVVEGGRVYFGGGDCNFYCLSLDGKPVWKTPTSLSYPSSVNLDAANATPSVTLVWNIPEAKEDIPEKYKADTVRVADYGEFSGNYIDVTKSGYIGKKSYI